MADEYTYDVFISYSHNDEDWVVEYPLASVGKCGFESLY